MLTGDHPAFRRSKSNKVIISAKYEQIYMQNRKNDRRRVSRFIRSMTMLVRIRAQFCTIDDPIAIFDSMTDQSIVFPVWHIAAA
jgi:hypothetical protein